jgi:hypothetical protein
MSNINATLQANAVAVPPVRNKVNKSHGRVRYFESNYDAAVDGVAAVADTITWGSLPIGARVIGHLSQLRWSTGTSSSTLNLGDAASAARHLAATAIATAGSAVPEAASAGGVAGFETSDASSAATNDCTLISTVAGADIKSDQKITLRVAYVCD